MKNNTLTIPISIIVGALLIGGAIVYTRSQPNTSAPANTVEKTTKAKPVTADDHILGDINAKVLIVEYSDTECPFCKYFDETMGKIMNTYQANGTVAWVYRHSPVLARHPLAQKEAEATECVNKIAGNEIFWKYIRKIYEITPANNGLDPAQLPILAASFGVDKKAFQSCLDSDTFAAKVKTSYEDSIAAGMLGTPYTVLIAKKPLNNSAIQKINAAFEKAAVTYKTTADSLGYVTIDKKVVFNGNMPYELVQEVVDAMAS